MRIIQMQDELEKAFQENSDLIQRHEFVGTQHAAELQKLAEEIEQRKLQEQQQVIDYNTLAAEFALYKRNEEGRQLESEERRQGQTLQIARELHNKSY